MSRLYIYVLTTLYLCSVACSDHEIDHNEINGNEIMFAVENTQTNHVSRATLFDNSDALYSELNGGGNFTIQAYVTRTNTMYMNARVWYFADVERWRFREDNTVYHSYWPKNNSLNFFIHMPWDLSAEGCDYVTLGNYHGLNGPTFSCNIPKESTDTEKVNEFIYAYRTAVSNETQVRDPDNVIRLKFVHPFAAVNLRLKQSHRNLTIHKITFKNAYNSGSYTNAYDTYVDGFVHATWLPNTTGSRDRVIHVNKVVPDDINFDAEIGGPYLVMPQSLTGVTSADDISIDINYTWDTHINETASVKLVDAHPTITEWLPGNKYTYTLDLGDNKEEILFKVSVEAWEPIDYTNEIVVD